MRVARHEVLERVFNALWREGFAESRRLSAGLALVRLPGGAEVAAPALRVGSLDVVRTGFPYYLRVPGGSLEPLSEPEELVELLPESDGMRQRWREEVAQSADNMGYFLDRARGRREELGSAKSLLAAAPAAAARLSVRPEEYLESWVLRGHPLHPGCKTRWGFDERDLARYSPELGRPIRLSFFALKRDHVVETSSRSDAPAVYPGCWTGVFDAELAELGLDASSYAVMAAHPWQAARVLPRHFGEELKTGVLVPLSASFPAQPLVSVRTMAPLSTCSPLHLKLPLAIQSTSAERTVSAPSVRNGPALSRWIAAALEQTRGLSRILELQEEVHGLHYRAPDSAESDPAALEKARHLSLLARTRPEELPGTTLVPAALLSELSPIDGRPVAAELAERRGDPVLFFAECAEVTARALLPLLARGLALEAHGQNVLLRLDKRGRPASWVQRDLGGVRFLASWMKEVQAFEPHPATLIAAADEAELVGKLHHSWLQGFLAPIADALVEGCGAHESTLWEAARHRVRVVWERSSPGGARGAMIESLLFAPRVRVKALTRMRLNRRYAAYDWCEIDNPLAEAGA